MKEEALKARLRTIGVEQDITPDKVWKQLQLERFLARLSVSKYKNKFILKGALLLAQYIPINRETIDADLLQAMKLNILLKLPCSNNRQKYN